MEKVPISISNAKESDVETIPVTDRFALRVNAFLPAENNHIFNEPAFFKLHSASPNDIYAQLVRCSDQRVCATLSAYEASDGLFVSPKRGTYGGVGLNSPLERQVVEGFVNAVIGRVRIAGGRELRLKCAPFSHDLALASVVTNIVLRKGSRISGHELNYDMHIDTTPYESRIDYGNAKRIRKCLREGFIAELIHASHYRSAYQVIQENRERRGFPISLTGEQLQVMTDTFPDRLHYFAVYAGPDRSLMVAAAVCIAVSSSILYVFYWGDIAGVHEHSPIALLASRIYRFCQQHGFRLLDAGTATVEGVPNDGLIKFKRNLGFSESLKLTFTWMAQP